jgi:hypothetical protein
MDELEKFFAENRGQLDDVDLPEGHEQRFMSRIHAQKSRISIKTFALAAASVSIVLALTAALSLIYGNYFSKEFSWHFPKGSTAQFMEVEAYYRSQLLQKYRAIEKLASSTDPSVKPEAKQLIEEFDREGQRLKDELPRNPRSDMVLGAMYENYQSRLEVLEKIEGTLAEGNP